MANSFIFLPDISGFTEFINSTEVEHSSHIIKELLELLIDAEKLQLSLAEIEGDALFFYAHQKVPTAQQLFEQVQEMFQKFHSHLMLYDHHRICDCGACSSASKLTLKFIAHAGPLEFIQIKDQRKPFGKEVISAHRLMKNDVPSDEYLLLSEGLLASLPNIADSYPSGLTKTEGQSTYDFGSVNYQYFMLTQWKENISLPAGDITGTRVSNPFKASINVNATGDQLFEWISSLDKRALWNDSITDLKYDPHKINQAGNEHICVIRDQQILIETLPASTGEGRWEYGEKVKTIPIPFIKEMANYFIIEEKENGALLTAEFHIKLPNWISWLIRPFLKKALEANMQYTLGNIKKLAEA